MSSLLERFCRYVRVDTQANESATTYPSSSGQLELGKSLLAELRDLIPGGGRQNDGGRRRGGRRPEVGLQPEDVLKGADGGAVIVGEVVAVAAAFGSWRQYDHADRPIAVLCLFIRAFVQSGCQQLQLNTLNVETLRDAQRHPERHKNLVVRVWGWSGYFCELDEAYQNQIIGRHMAGH